MCTSLTFEQNMMSGKTLSEKEEKALADFLTLDCKSITLIMLHWWLRFGKMLTSIDL